MQFLSSFVWKNNQYNRLLDPKRYRKVFDTYIYLLVMTLGERPVEVLLGMII